VYTHNVRSPLAVGLVAAVAAGAIALPPTAGHLGLPGARVVSDANIFLAGCQGGPLGLGEWCYSNPDGNFDPASLTISGPWSEYNGGPLINLSVYAPDGFEYFTVTTRWSGTSTYYPNPTGAVVGFFIFLSDLLYELNVHPDTTAVYPEGTPPAARGEGWLTTALKNPAPAIMQVANNWSGYVHDVLATPKPADFPKILEEMVGHAGAVAGVLAGAVPEMLGAFVAQSGAVLDAIVQVTKLTFAGSLRPLAALTSVMAVANAVTAGAGLGTFGEPGYIPSVAFLVQKTQGRLVEALGGVSPWNAYSGDGVFSKPEVEAPAAATTARRTAAVTPRSAAATTARRTAAVTPRSTALRAHIAASPAAAAKAAAAKPAANRRASQATEPTS